MNPQTSSHSARPPVTAPLDRAPVIVIIPAWNEEGSIGRVIDALPASHFTEVVVADNNSTDFTAEVARKFGATVVPATRQGYGSACLAGLAYVAALPPERQPRAIVFIDADFSDHPEQLPDLVDPILAGETDFVIGSRMLLEQPRGALLPQAVFGNKLACFLMWLLWRAKFTNFGWTVEMQIKAARAGLRCREVPVRYRPRIGLSKITGTLSGTFRAGYKILYTIARYSLSR
jgi:glycosyltransferase involved in cell wall biosynthesis